MLFFTQTHPNASSITIWAIGARVNCRSGFVGGWHFKKDY